MEVCHVRCPNLKCGFIFNSYETFWWASDKDGFPTIESISCPKCKSSTQPKDKRRKQFKFDSFEEV